MAFSINIGTKWCHDFPKLARESGFYFNTHKSKARIDWNRISNIDIERIIRERDFYSVDDNINNVIDYCLESEYDVKILDPNFVKLFHLAQLAVEYLLYCKQYLDHSVIILKDELRSKIEENVRLKKEINSLEEMIQHLKEKGKHRNRLIETKIGDCSGEIYKCPHCPKTFISSIFVSAHILRRHAYSSDLYTPSSPIHEHYRNETEKLHDEIKNLKERLNETEKVIRNESEKATDKKAVEYDKKQSENEVNVVNQSEKQQELKGYQEEIKNLKTMLFDEIHNLRQKERTVYEYKAETNVQTLINQQEKEFQKLKNQLFEKLTPDLESMNAKLYAQEDYWKSKIEQIEDQHHKDIEKLTLELKLTQKLADNMKAEYESKVSDLERQAADQSNILIEQSKQLHSLTNDINVSQLNEKDTDSKNDLPKTHNQFVVSSLFNESRNKSNENDPQDKAYLNVRTQRVIVGNIDNARSLDSFNKGILQALENKLPKNGHTLMPKTQTILCKNKNDIKPKPKTIKDTKLSNERSSNKDSKYYHSNDNSESEDFIVETEDDQEMKRKKQDLNTESIKRPELNESSANKLENISNKHSSRDFISRVKSIKQPEVLSDDLTSETNSELSVSDSPTHSETESIIEIHNNYETHTSVSLKSKKITDHNSSYKKQQINVQDTFEQKLRDLGIDPEWQGIPNATFKQKMDILKHHQKIAAKKFPKYRHIKLKIIKEVLDKISKKRKVTESPKHLKKSPSPKLITNVKSTPVKVLSNKKSPEYTSIIQTPSNHDPALESDNEPSFKSTKTSNSTKVQISPNTIKSLGDIHRTINIKSSDERNSLSKTKSLIPFDSEQLKTTLNNKPMFHRRFTGSNSMDNLNMEREPQNISLSPKQNKSVLKSTGSTNSLIKKKVIFDLANEKDKESLSDYDMKKEESNDSNWKTSSISDEEEHPFEREIHKPLNNIVLKTSQSDKIAEISRKLEAQLSMVRQKPVGSVETVFSSTYKQEMVNEKKDSFLESSIKTSDSKLTNDILPSSSNPKEEISETLYAQSVSDISDLDSDIDKILKLE